MTLHTQVADLNTRANEMMMLKFGRVVNLDALEGLTTNKLISELDKKVRAHERGADHQIAALEVSKAMQLGAISDSIQDESDALKQQLVKVTRENTHKLTELHHFANKDRQLEDSLNNRQKSMVTCPPPPPLTTIILFLGSSYIR